MEHVFGKTLLFGLAALVLLSAPSAMNAQWGDPVSVYDARNGQGNESNFGVGEFRSNRGEFGTLRNDAAYSVSVPRGFRVRFCENEGGNGQGSGNCEEYGEGNHNLRYAGQASYLRVWGPAGGWNGGGQQGVTVFEDRFSGRSQSFGIGRYLNVGGGLGNLRNDRASSVVVQRGFRVRICSDEGSSGRGEGRCEEYNEGRHNLRYDDDASFIEVRRAGRGWGGGGWNDPPGGGGGWGNDNGGGGGSNVVVVFADPNQRGRRQEFGVGTYRSDRGGLGQLGNDEASSVFVPRGYRVRICDREGGFFGNGGGRCEEYGPGSHNLRYDDTASFIRVTRN